jgi:hypothetical protein
MDKTICASISWFISHYLGTSCHEIAGSVKYSDISGIPESKELVEKLAD